jgi:hypothetical protein
VPWPASSSRAWRLIVAAAVLAGLIVAAVSTRTALDTYPVADTATTSIYTLRAMRGELAVGSYSRYGWNHPGPLLYQALALPYALSGRREIALKWTALGLNLGWMAATLVVIGRRSPRLAIALAVSVVPLLWREQRLLFSAWNAFVPVLALPLAAALAADLDVHRRWTLTWLAATLSFCVQAHVGLTVVGAAILAVGLAAAWPVARGAWARAIVVTGLLWAVPLVHEVLVRPGNLEAMVSFLGEARQAHVSWGRAIEVSAYMLVGPLLPGWLVLEGEVPAALPLWLPAAWIGLLAAAGTAAVWNHRRGDRFDAVLALVGVAATLAVPVAAHGVVGPMSDYLLAWAPAVGAIDFAIVLTLLSRLASSAPLAWTSIRAPLLAAALVLWAVVGGSRLTGKHAEQARDTTLRALSADLLRYCREHGLERPVVDFDPAAWRELAGLVLQFDKADVPIAVSDDGLYLVGPPFARTGYDPATFYLMLTTGAVPAAYEGRTEWVATRGAVRIVRVMTDRP